MEFNAARFANPAILELQPYQIGKPISEVEREFGLTRITKLASNENPLGTSEYVTHHLMAELSNVARYPDGGAFAFKEALSQHLKVFPEQLILGNGSEEVLRMLMQTFVWGTGHIIIPQYSFIAYKILAQGFGIQTIETPSKEYGIDCKAILAAVTPETKMVILANPNNPTGTYINNTEFDHLLKSLPKDVIVVCDEAYYEYVTEKDYPQTIPKISQYPNLIVTRTFSKAYGLAGLRLGYGVAHPQLVELINRVRQPFNLNHLAMVAGTLALSDQAFVEKSIDVNQQGKVQLYSGIQSLGLTYVPSVANFIMVNVKNEGAKMFQSLLEKGVIVRPLSPYDLSQTIRVSVGLEEENAHFLEAMKTVLNEVKN